MSDSERLLPLLDDNTIAPELRSALEAASEHEPSPRELDALGAHLAAALPPGVLPPPPPAPPAPPAAPTGGGPSPAAPAGAGGGAAAAAASAGMATKMFVGFAVVAAGLGALYVTRAQSVHSTQSFAASSATTAPTLSAPSLVAEANVDAVPTQAPAQPTALPTTTPSARRSASPVETTPEPALLARAHDALLRGAPDKALAIATEHATTYPRGALAQEREVIAIEALVALGRREEARRRSAAFATAYPNSSHRERLARLVNAP